MPVIILALGIFFGTNYALDKAEEGRKEEQVKEVKVVDANHPEEKVGTNE